MAGELERLLIRLEADTTQLRRALAQADSAVGQYASKTDRALSQTERRFASMARSVRGLLGGMAFGVAIKEVVQLADAYTLMNNRLNVVSKSSGDLELVQRRVMEISKEARASVEDTAELYSRYSFALKDAGVTTNEVLDFTEALSKAVKVSGASSSEAAGALRQLSQGLAAGALRGEELNSIMEQMPIVADLIAQKMGVTTGELKKLGEQGAITREKVFQALIDGLGDLRKSFDNTTPTISEGLTTLGDSLLRFVGRATDATGIGATFTAMLKRMSEVIDEANANLAAGTGLFGHGGEVTPYNRAGKGQSLYPQSGDAAKSNAIAGIDPFSFGAGMQGNIRPPAATGPAAPDPWAASIIPASAEEQLRAMKEAWDEVRQAQNATLDDLINANWQSGEAKMAALEKAVRGGEISWGDYQDGLRATESQTQRSNDAMLSATSQFLDTMFANNKTAATASALIDTYAGITRTLRDYSPPQSFAMAAMQAAMGFAQVRAIQSTSRRSSGGGAAASVPSGAAAAGAGNAAAPASQTQTLTVRGLGVGELLDRRGLRDLLERIRDMQRDGYQLVVG